MSQQAPKSPTRNAGTGGDVIGLKGTGGHGNVLTGTRHMASSCHFAAAG